jgi:ribosome-associated heat shock protein Hsp15
MTVERRAVRVDKWLWSVRAIKTRTAATDACSSGRVSVNGAPAKPATRVAVGDTVTARLRERTVVYVVEKLIEKRVSAALAAECFRDESPPPEPGAGLTRAPLVAARDKGSGRPTKRDRRRTDQLRRRH